MHVHYKTSVKVESTKNEQFRQHLTERNISGELVTKPLEMCYSV